METYIEFLFAALFTVLVIGITTGVGAALYALVTELWGG